jgi:hypothetical protein
LTTDASICAISTPSDIVSKISVVPCVPRERAGASIIAMPSSAVVLYGGQTRNDRESLKF